MNWYKISKKYDSVIIAIFLNSKEAKKIAIKDKGAEKADQLHITLLYFGKAVDIEHEKNKIRNILSDAIKDIKPFKAKISGKGRFDGDDKDCFYYSIDSAELCNFRNKLKETFENKDIKIDETHGFTPHISIKFVDKKEDCPEVKPKLNEISIEKITLAWAGENEDFDLK